MKKFIKHAKEKNMSNSSSLKSKIMIFVVIILTLASGALTGAVLSSISKSKGEPVAQAKSTTTTEQAVTAEEKSAEDKKQEDENAKKLEEQKKADEAKAAEEQKKAEEAKQAEADKAKETTSKNTTTTQASTYPKGIVFETGVRIVENKQQEDAKTGVNIISSGLAYSTKSNGVTFKVAASGTTVSVPYKATIHLKSGDVVYKGAGSSQLQSVAVASSKVPAGSKVVIDYEATYKGKVYKFTNSFTRSK
jgi:cell wall-associated NlpC family hydrolase